MKINNNLQIECISFTNKGYVSYTENLIESIKQNKSEIDINIFCIDEESYNYLENKHDNLTLHNQEEDLSEFMDQKSANFGKLMIKKFSCIHQSLLENEYVVYIDGDIVIKKNFMPLFKNLINKYEIIFQNDENPNKRSQLNLCAGFMVISSNKKTLKFFNPKNMPINKVINYRTHDQTYINRNAAKFSYGILPKHQFPNGPYFYENSNNIDPYLIHFNYLLGDKKIETMKRYNEWYI